MGTAKFRSHHLAPSLKIAVAILALLAFVAPTFAVGIAYSPPSEAPSPCAPTGIPNSTTTTNSCAGWGPPNPYLSYYEIVEGFVFAAALSSLFALKPKLLRAAPFVARVFEFRVSIPQRVRKVVLLSSLAGVTAFGLMVVADLSFFVPALNQSWVWWVTGVLTSGTSQEGFIGLGALLISVATTVGLLVSCIDDGVGIALRRALVIFTLPATIALRGGALRFRSGSNDPLRH